MTNQQHPITPPPYLVEQWEADWHCSGNTNGNGFTYFVATRAAQWGADQELEACIAWFDKYIPGYELVADRLRAARRPKPPSLKEQALLAIDTAVADDRLSADVANVVRRALESIND
jgi:hypothetical protein